MSRMIILLLGLLLVRNITEVYPQTGVKKLIADVFIFTIGVLTGVGL